MEEIFGAASTEARQCLLEAGASFQGSWEKTLNTQQLGGLPKALAVDMYRAEVCMRNADPMFFNRAAGAAWMILAAGEIAAIRGESMDAAYASMKDAFAELGITPDYAGAGPLPWPSVGPSSPAG